MKEKAVIVVLLTLLCGSTRTTPAHAQADTEAVTEVLTVRAVRISAFVQIDGRPEEPVWSQAEPATGFVQNEPDNGAPASLDTEVRLLYDDENLYVGVVLHDTLGRSGVRVPALKRDFDYDASDVFSLILDPFADQRNAYVFQVNPFGVQRDLEVREGITFNIDWDAVWTARAQIGENGWTAEMAIPWATLRYPGTSGGDAWLVNFTRGARRIAETSGWAVWPRSYSPYHMQYAGTLVGLQPPPPSTNVQVQPFVLGQEQRIGRESALAGANRGKTGGDVKWALSPSTVLDLTVNTDFAQVESDEQVINLSRYSVFFPEKRSFFLESAGIFTLGYSLFTPFYSRRIGLSGGLPVPLDTGARLTRSNDSGQAGLLVVRQRETDLSPVSHFGVGRFSRNIGGAGGRLGGMVVARHDEATSGSPETRNIVAAIDGYSRLSATSRVTAFASMSTTHGPDGAGEGFASYMWIRTNARWGYLGFLQDIASKDYKASTGFIFRNDVILNSPAGNLDYRPTWRPESVLKFDPGFSVYHYNRLSDGQLLQSDVRVTPFSVVFKNAASVKLSGGPTWQVLDEAEAVFFRPVGVGLDAGRYRYVRAGIEGETDPSARWVASGLVFAGSFYDGSLVTVDMSLQARVSPRATIRGRYERLDVSGLGPQDEDVISHLVQTEARLALNPQLQFLAFYQYNTQAETGVWNLRLSYEFRPLSYIYLVFNDARYHVSSADRMASPGAFDTRQQFVFKLSYLAQL